MSEPFIHAIYQVELIGQGFTMTCFCPPVPVLSFGCLLDIHLLIAESVAHPLYMASVFSIACREANSEFVSTQFCYRFALLFDRDINISLVSFRNFSTFTLPSVLQLLIATLRLTNRLHQLACKSLH